MSPLIIAGLEALVPILVHRAEGSHPPGTGEIKHAWVTGFVSDLFLGLENRFNVPGWAQSIDGEIQIMVKTLIEKALEKLDG